MINSGCVLVTGVAGFIGSHLFSMLLSNEIDVYGLVRKTTDLSNLCSVINENGGVSILL